MLIGHNLFEILNYILKLDLMLKVPNLFELPHCYIKQKLKKTKK